MFQQTTQFHEEQVFEIPASVIDKFMWGVTQDASMCK